MNPCITIDVSKESSHIQGFLDFEKQLSKPKKFNHTKEGFATILLIYNQIIEKTNITPIVYFEYTGVYHKTLVAFLKENNIEYHPIPPLVAAKVRKSDIRNKKTDTIDCKNLSYFIYENKNKIKLYFFKFSIAFFIKMYYNIIRLIHFMYSE